MIGPGVFHRFNRELHSTPARTIYRFTPGEFTTLFCAIPEIQAGVTALPPFIFTPQAMPVDANEISTAADYGKRSCVKMRIARKKMNCVQDS